MFTGWLYDDDASVEIENETWPFTIGVPFSDCEEIDDCPFMDGPDSPCGASECEDHESDACDDYVTDYCDTHADDPGCYYDIDDCPFDGREGTPCEAEECEGGAHDSEECRVYVESYCYLNEDDPGCLFGDSPTFVCGNGDVIPFDWVNDGEEDCSDGSDEQQYDSDGNRINWFDCHDGSEVWVDQVNDGYENCPDGEDEGDGGDDPVPESFHVTAEMNTLEEWTITFEAEMPTDWSDNMREGLAGMCAELGGSDDGDSISEECFDQWIEMTGSDDGDDGPYLNAFPTGSGGDIADYEMSLDGSANITVEATELTDGTSYTIFWDIWDATYTYGTEGYWVFSGGSSSASVQYFIGPDILNSADFPGGCYMFEGWLVDNDTGVEIEYETWPFTLDVPLSECEEMDCPFMDGPDSPCGASACEDHESDACDDYVNDYCETHDDPGCDDEDDYARLDGIIGAEPPNTDLDISPTNLVGALSDNEGLPMMYSGQFTLTFEGADASLDMHEFYIPVDDGTWNVEITLLNGYGVTSCEGCEDLEIDRNNARFSADEPVTLTFGLLPDCDHVVGLDSTGYGFDPVDLTISVGETVCWQWTDALDVHNVVETIGEYNTDMDLTIEVGFYSPASSYYYTSNTVDFRHTFTEDNMTHYYVCTPHATMGMVGKVTVGEGSEEDPVQEIVDESGLPSVGFIVAAMALVGAAGLRRRH